MELIIKICLSGIAFIVGAFLYTLADILFEKHPFTRGFIQAFTILAILFILINVIFPNV